MASCREHSDAAMCVTDTMLACLRFTQLLSYTSASV